MSESRISGCHQTVIGRLEPQKIVGLDSSLKPGFCMDHWPGSSHFAVPMLCSPAGHLVFIMMAKPSNVYGLKGPGRMSFGSVHKMLGGHN